MSINIEHKDLPLGQNHASFNWKVNNVSDLNLISVVTADINKEAYVESTKTKYILKSVSPAAPLAANTTNVSIVPPSTPTANTDMTVHIQGLLQTTSAGDFGIQFRTEDATGTITIQPKSILVIEKIG